MKMSLNNLQLSGVAACVPKNKVMMSEFYEKFGKNEVDRICLSTGIKSLHLAPTNLNTSDMCIKASLELFNKLEINKSDIDAIVFITQTPDYIMPATSCILQNKLKLKKDILAFDINYGCSGYIYGLLQAGLLINSGACNKVLVCVGDTISKHLDPEDHKLKLVMGDGASASVIEKGHDTWSFDIKTDGSGYEKLIIPKNNNSKSYLYMDGAAIMEFALREVKGVVDSVLRQQAKPLDAVSALVLHQANSFMLQYLRKKIGAERSTVPVEVEKYGNTGSASIPITMCEHYFNKDINLSSAVLAGFGVGLSWGAVLLSLKNTVFTKVYEI
jgi:3-oxoacyl-[acyl-carrier-protein] synthase-3